MNDKFKRLLKVAIIVYIVLVAVSIIIQYHSESVSNSYYVVYDIDTGRSISAQVVNILNLIRNLTVALHGSVVMFDKLMISE